MFFHFKLKLTYLKMLQITYSLGIRKKLYQKSQNTNNWTFYFCYFLLFVKFLIYFFIGKTETTMVKNFFFIDLVVDTHFCCSSSRFKKIRNPCRFTLSFFFLISSNKCDLLHVKCEYNSTKYSTYIHAIENVMLFYIKLLMQDITFSNSLNRNNKDDDILVYCSLTNALLGSLSTCIHKKSGSFIFYW